MATLDEIEAQHHEAEKRVVQYEAELRILDLNQRAARQEEHEIIYATAVVGTKSVGSYNQINAMVWHKIKRGEGIVAKAWLAWHEGKTRLALAMVEEAHLKNLYFDKKEAIKQRL